MPLTTPQQFIAYFRHLSENARPSSPRWKIGLEAAQAWSAYIEDPSTLRMLRVVTILMPYRVAGSGFVSLWENLLNHLLELPIESQFPVWQAIFNSANHGKNLIPETERAIVLLDEWKQVAAMEMNEPINFEQRHKLMKHIQNGYALSREWSALEAALLKWGTVYPPN